MSASADALAAAHDVAPEGFEEVMPVGGFVRMTGPFYLHARLPILALRIGPQHLNVLRIGHGGLLATLVDTAFGAVMKRELAMHLPPATVSLSCDYIAPVREGDWVQAHVELHKAGRRLTNASCLVRADERLVVRASGVFVHSGPQAL